MAAKYSWSCKRYAQHTHGSNCRLKNQDTSFLQNYIDDETTPCRRYKNGFVWHDLSEGDLLLPAQGNEYVLKGSELQLDQSTPGINSTNNETLYFVPGPIADK
jgi:hypothetical protein